jgi:hypothetical protein
MFETHPWKKLVTFDFITQTEASKFHDIWKKICDKMYASNNNFL